MRSPRNRPQHPCAHARGSRGRLRAARGPRGDLGADGPSSSHSTRCGSRTRSTATASFTRSAFRRLKHKTQVFVVARLRPRRHAHDAHHRGAAGRPHDRARAQPQRGPRRGDRAGATTSDTRRSGMPARTSLAELLPDGFRHNEQSLRIVDLLARDGRGLNLTSEVREGILKHSKARESVAAEAWGTASTPRGPDREARRLNRLPQPRHRGRGPRRASSRRPTSPPRSRRRSAMTTRRASRPSSTDCVARVVAAAQGDAERPHRAQP